MTATVINIPAATFNLNNTCPGAFVVTSNGDNGPGTLRDIINNSCSGSVVTFDPSVVGTIALTSGELKITKAITINGPGANVLAISGNSLSRVFELAGTINISGLTIKNGLSKPDGTDFFGGMGVLVTSGTVNLTDSVITNNDATNSGNSQGGGVDNEGGILTLSRCAVTNNTASFFGGGIYSEGAGSTTILNSTIAGNTTGTGGGGGGIGYASTVTLTNSTVFGNSANGGGNIFRNGAGTLTFKNSIIGGGILIGNGGELPTFSHRPDSLQPIST